VQQPAAASLVKALLHCFIFGSVSAESNTVDSLHCVPCMLLGPTVVATCVHVHDERA
jgi:hypothetical protein